jgi:uncharacterized membrane protein YqjE
MLRIDKLRPAASALLTHGVLVLKLAQVEWTAEKRRLQGMLALSLVAFGITLALLLFVSLLAIALLWNSPYLWAMALGIVAFHVAGLWLALQRLQKLARMQDRSFAGTQEELTADFALFKRKLSL